jgi:hypothetical protein
MACFNFHFESSGHFKFGFFFQKEIFFIDQISYFVHQTQFFFVRQKFTDFFNVCTNLFVYIG